MIRFSIFFLTFFLLVNLTKGWSQDKVNLICYDHDIIAWELSTPDCTNPVTDSFSVFIQDSINSEFQLLIADTALNSGIQDDALKTAHAVFVEYTIRCPDTRLIRSDTLLLSSLREAVELDSVRVLANGDVELTWKEKPMSGVRYVVNAAVQGSSQVLASNIEGNTYTDTRGLANREIEYYSISAALKCGYTFPEPDSFYHTSLLDYEIIPCGGGINFTFIPFSYWNGGTAASDLIVLRNGRKVDTITLTPGESSFTYDGLVNNETYTFYVRETGNDRNAQVAYSNPITINSDFYEPIKWIVIEGITIDNQNQATILWETNDHDPGFSFRLHQNETSVEISETDLNRSRPYNYAYTFPALPAGDTEYRISLQDSCGNTVESLPKRALITRGQLGGGIDLNVQWNDVGDDEWKVEEYDVFTVSNGSFSLLGTVDGLTSHFQYTFDENNPIDSVCYYIVAKGEVYFADSDSTGDLSIQSNTVCLHGETLIQLPNAYSSNQNPYRPIIVPNSNIASYTFRVFDRYGNLVFESHDPSEGWNGLHQGKTGFMDVYVVQVEMTNSQGEQISKSGSVLLFP